jgi:hypothetical protein
VDQLEELERSPFNGEAREVRIGNDLIGRACGRRILRDRSRAVYPEARRLCRDGRLSQSRGLVCISAATRATQMFAQEIKQSLHPPDVNGGKPPRPA